MNFHIKALCKRAGIDSIVTFYKSIGNKNPKVPHKPKHKKVAVHTARRTWATLAYHHTKDIVLVSNRIGHKNTKTALRYIGVTDVDESKLQGLFSD